MSIITSATSDQYRGVLYGLALGDGIGAKYEGGPLERLLWWFLSQSKPGKLRYSDDTLMALNLANSFLEMGRIDQESLAKEFAKSYQWQRGYGPASAKLLKRIRNGKSWKSEVRRVFKSGSYGNGAAMRAAVIALFKPNDLDDLLDMTSKASEVTHAHPLAVEGAKLIAAATYFALQSLSSKELLTRLVGIVESHKFRRKLQAVDELLLQKNIAETCDIRKRLGNNMTALNSCGTAIYLGLAYRDRPILDMIDTACALRGDTDTIAAMAGAIWGACNGATKIESDLLDKLEASKQLKGLANSLVNQSRQ